MNGVSSAYVVINPTCANAQHQVIGVFSDEKAALDECKQTCIDVDKLCIIRCNHKSLEGKKLVGLRPQPLPFEDTDTDTDTGIACRMMGDVLVTYQEKMTSSELSNRCYSREFFPKGPLFAVVNESGLVRGLFIASEVAGAQLTDGCTLRSCRLRDEMDVRSRGWQTMCYMITRNGPLNNGKSWEFVFTRPSLIESLIRDRDARWRSVWVQACEKNASSA